MLIVVVYAKDQECLIIQANKIYSIAEYQQLVEEK